MILDGGIGDRAAAARAGAGALDEPLWGTRALIDDPDAVLDVHRALRRRRLRRHLDEHLGAAERAAGDGPRLWDRDAPVHWMDVARRGLRLARQAVAERGRDGECAVAFSLNGDVDCRRGRRDDPAARARCSPTSPPPI